MWLHVRSLIEFVCENWTKKDEGWFSALLLIAVAKLCLLGIWEVRGGQQHFLYSKLMCWVAMDRGIRLAERRSFPADIHRWRSIRNVCRWP